MGGGSSGSPYMHPKRNSTKRHTDEMMALFIFILRRAVAETESRSVEVPFYLNLIVRRQLGLGNRQVIQACALRGSPPASLSPKTGKV